MKMLTLFKKTFLLKSTTINMVFKEILMKSSKLLPPRMMMIKVKMKSSKLFPPRMMMIKVKMKSSNIFYRLTKIMSVTV